MTAALTTVARVGQAVPMGEVPDPQVPEKAKRRTYTAKYKRDIRLFTIQGVVGV